MELKQIKCQNCGAKIKVGMNDHEADCEFCKAHFIIEDDYSKSYKSTKGMLDAAEEHLGKVGFGNFGKKFKTINAISSVIFVVAFLFVFGMIGFTIFSGIKSDNEFEVKRFNGVLELHSGSISFFSLDSAIDDVIESNKKNDRQITITYNDKTVKTEEEMLVIKKTLKEKSVRVTDEDYYVSYTYDKKGYISDMKIVEV